MLIGDSRILGAPVLSLHVGGEIARTAQSVIDPDDLRVIAFKVTKSVPDLEAGDILQLSDVREFSRLGFIIDSADELVRREDVVRLDKIMGLGFNLVGMAVVTRSGTKLGKIIGYTVDSESFLVQQLIVKRPLLKSFIDPELVIGREQITEVNDNAVVIKDEKGKTKAPEKTEAAAPIAANFVNPFREPA